MATDPEHVERAKPPALRYDGEAIEPADLDFGAAAVTAVVLAEALDGYDEDVLEDAVRYARAELDSAGSGRFVALVMDFTGDPEKRGLVYERLASHVERRRAEERDVEGLFEE